MSHCDISIIITSYKEPRTIGRAVSAFMSQVDGMDVELMVVCPDDETALAAKDIHDITVRKDPGRGKPAALNLGISKASGEIVVMSDGDVYIGDGALKALLKPFDDPEVGAVSGRPVSTNPRDEMLGYWSHLLTEAGAHQERLDRDSKGEFLVCSGYLYAIRKSLIDGFPEDALAEDAVISHIIGNSGYTIRYAPDAEVFVVYPDNYQDWLKQKVRSAGGYAQPVIADSPLRMRSFKHEILSGAIRSLKFPENAREFFWTIALFIARLHLWSLIFWRVRVFQTPLVDLWKRVESTK